jgi:hypothetical protein
VPRVQRFFLYDEGEPSIADFIRLKPEQILALTKFVDGNGFTGSPEELLTLAETLGLSYEKTADLVQFAGFLHAERARLNLDVDGVIQEFETYFERHENELHITRQQLTALYEPLRKLFSDRSEIARRMKIASVTSGVLPEAIDFHSLCDLRPVFNEERDAVFEYVPVALIRVLVRNELRQDSAFIFQIDRQGIAKLDDFLTRLKTKMAVLEGVRSELIGAKK